MGLQVGKISGYIFDDEREWLKDFASRLSYQRARKAQELEYWNHPELPEAMRAQGYYVCYQSVNRSGHPLYLMISRSHTDYYPTLGQIVEELNSPRIQFPFDGFGEYENRKHGPEPGTWATIKFEDRWYMLSQSGSRMPKPYHKLTAATEPDPRSKPLTIADLRARQSASRTALK